MTCLLVVVMHTKSAGWRHSGATRQFVCNVEHTTVEVAVFAAKTSPANEVPHVKNCRSIKYVHEST